LRDRQGKAGDVNDPPPVPLNDLGRAVRHERRAVLERISDVLDSGHYVMGAQHDAFEAEFAAWTGAPHALGVASGTDALVLALLAVGVGHGDEVVTAANAGGYASAAVLAVGARPRYVDVDPGDLLMPVDAVKASLASRAAAAVVVTHLYGNAAPAAEIAAVCESAGTAVIEDCAQAAGLRVAGRHVGSAADVAAYSFYPTKNLGAIGDGGAVTTSRDDLANRVRALRQYGWSGKYEVGLAGGRNSRLDEIQAAILRYRLQSVDDQNAFRRAILLRYASALPASAGRILGVRDQQATGVAHLAVAVMSDRAATAAKLEPRVSTGVHYPVPDHHQPGWSGLVGDATPLPVTEDACKRVLTLPCFPEMTSEEVDQVCEALRVLG
jgi:dTDP-4-amino-4,6-dideoxygalactose transaminase